MTSPQPATTFIGVELDDQGAPTKLAMVFNEKTLMVFSTQRCKLEIPQNWRQDLSAWDDGMSFAHPYRENSPQDLVIRRLVAERDLREDQVLSIQDMAPDQETRKAVEEMIEAIAGGAGVDEIVKAYQEAVETTPF